MEKIMTSVQLVERLKLAQSKKTLYVMGCFGAPLNDSNKKRYTSNHSYNKQAARTKLINEASADTFGFDCVCLIKGVLGGWSADSTKSYGGTKVYNATAEEKNKYGSSVVYGEGRVPDLSADGIIKKYLVNVSTDFSNIVPGAVVHMSGHVGVYIGNGQVIECTPKWTNNVQISYLANNGYKQGNCRTWTDWGLIPCVEYVETQVVTPNTTDVNGKELFKLIEDSCSTIFKAYDTEDFTKLTKFTEWKEEALNKLSALSGVSPTEETNITKNEEASSAEVVDEKLFIWQYLKANLTSNEFGVAALMGNLRAESAFKSTNLQNSYEKKLNLSDAQYTAKVDSGEYSKDSFIHDSAGYGLAQWTYYSRKQAMYEYIKEKRKASIGDLTAQLEFLVKEVKQYSTVYKALCNAEHIRTASDVVLKKYENPKDQSETVCKKRADYSMEVFNEYNGK